LSTRRAFLKAGLGSLATAALPGCGGGGAPAGPGPTPSGPGLRDRAAARGLLYGGENQARYLSDSAFSEAFARECGILLPGLELKWNALRPTPQSFDFSRADALADFAARNGMRFRGHALVWHNALPSWVAGVINQGNAEQFMVEHINTVCGHYAGRMHSWNVVNEAIFPSDGLPGDLRFSPWYFWLGPEYIPLAYHTAAAADPAALLGAAGNEGEGGCLAGQR